jgi:hypothetical protein
VEGRLGSCASVFNFQELPQVLIFLLLLLLPWFFFLACVSAIFVNVGSNPWKVVFGGGIW